MINRDVTNDSPLWYYLEDVEWTQYFFGAYALHAAYWHNSFGFTRSHGCVNLTISDAKWLYRLDHALRARPMRSSSTASRATPVPGSTCT